MALIDVAELLTDPDFCDEYTIQRVTQSIDNNGRAVESIMDAPGYGSVQPVSSATLELFPDLVRASGQLQVFTRDILRSATAATAPDGIIWRGLNYRVQALSEWPHAGVGMVVAILIRLDFVGEAPA